MSDKSDIAERVRKVIGEHLDAPNDADITDDKGIIDDLGADSLDQVEIVMSLEVEFDIEILDDDFERAITVGDVIEIVRRRLA